MGADRPTRDRRAAAGARHAARAAACAALGAALLAGCASMPDSGDLRGVESTPKQDSQVRVFALPPSEDAPPSAIVQGFLEALTSDDPHFSTAKQYLTGDAARTWRPELSTTVLLDGPEAVADRTGDQVDGTDYAFTLTGTRLATVDAQQSYTATPGDYSQAVHLTRDKRSGQWRIDALPQGVVMGKSDFQRNYTSVDKYYFASNTTDGTARQPDAVADPIYVRQRVEPMTQVVRSLLGGPAIWLRPVVRSSFPTGTALQKGTDTLTPDDQNKLTVPLNDKAAGVGHGRCDEMAAQLLFTLKSLSPAVEEVELRAGDKRLCSLSADRARLVADRGSDARADYLYFINGEHRLVRMANTDSSHKAAEPVPGALGQGIRALRSVAVTRDEHVAAGVTLDGSALYVGSLVTGSTLGEPVLRSHGVTENDRLTTPSWDAQGDLWVADRDTAAPRLYVLPKGAGAPVTVRTPGLDGRIDAVRVAADGVRVALVVAKNGKQSLFIGRIERDTKSGEEAAVAVQELRSATPELEKVTAMSWAGDSRLVVAGQESGGVEQVQYVQCDGSIPEGSTLPGLTDVQSIAASADSETPLFATSEDGLLWLPGGSGWRTLKQPASAVFYPG
ncbi:LpqB family beta-propeller domain-containing protein [Streptomyces sp. bgisy153]|uniref:LpqB family beta-propeller domain-containing protein n=1 Tax=Streptomyces sp. bgisy153 TaxID=3413793 RepID=UPI003D763430